MASPFESKKKSAPNLNQELLVKMISDTFANLTDKRTGKNTRYDLSDAALSAFAVFFMQNPSFLAQQISLLHQPFQGVFYGLPESNLNVET